MIVYKGTMYFQGEGCGWSETHCFRTEEQAPDSKRFVEKTLAKLANRRAAALNRHTTMIALAARPIGMRNAGALVEINLTATNSDNRTLRTNEAPALGAYPSLCAVVEMSNQNRTATKRFYMRGIPDDAEVQQGKTGRDVPAWNEASVKYLRELMNSGWGWWGKVGGIGPRAITGYTTTPNGGVTVNVLNAFFPQALWGQKITVRFSGVNGKSPLNGAQVVLVSGANECTLARPLALGPYRTGGTISLNQMDFIPYWQFSWKGIGSRKVGAPLLRYRGRQSAKARI